MWQDCRRPCWQLNTKKHHQLRVLQERQKMIAFNFETNPLQYMQDNPLIFAEFKKAYEACQGAVFTFHGKEINPGRAKCIIEIIETPPGDVSQIPTVKEAMAAVEQHEKEYADSMEDMRNILQQAGMTDQLAELDAINTEADELAKSLKQELRDLGLDV